jgi:hypothetical protein
VHGEVRAAAGVVHGGREAAEGPGISNGVLQLVLFAEVGEVREVEGISNGVPQLGK